MKDEQRVVTMEDAKGLSGHDSTACRALERRNGDRLWIKPRVRIRRVHNTEMTTYNTAANDGQANYTSSTAS